MTLESIEHKEIETIIDQRKAFGLYDIEKINFIAPDEDCARCGDLMSEFDSTESFFEAHHLRNDPIPWENEAETTQTATATDNATSPKGLEMRSDSEVTVIRMKREGYRNQIPSFYHWASINDEAVPGDGTHLGESPSLVNLVTFIKNPSSSKLQKDAGEYTEYMVPISTWDPVATHSLTKPQEIAPNQLQGDSLTVPKEPFVEPELEEIHRSLNMTQISESRLHIPYMMKQKQSPRPGALFSNKPILTKKTDETIQCMETCENTFETIKAPPKMHKRKSLKHRMFEFIRAIGCECCRTQKTNPNKKHKKTTDVADVAVQTIQINENNFPSVMCLSKL